jgi:hypothetical protein
MYFAAFSADWLAWMIIRGSAFRVLSQLWRYAEELLIVFCVIPDSAQRNAAPSSAINSSLE